MVYNVIRCKDFAYVSHLNNVAYQINIENTLEIVVTIYILLWPKSVPFWSHGDAGW